MARIIIITPPPPPRPQSAGPSTLQGGEWNPPDGLSLPDQLRWIATQIDGHNPTT